MTSFFTSLAAIAISLFILAAVVAVCVAPFAFLMWAIKQFRGSKS